MIKPEDVPKELVDAITKDIGLKPIAWDCPKPEKLVAAILNAAIEAGAASPPCWVGRDRHGNLLSSLIAYTSNDPSQLILDSDRLEHWKGQTE